MVSTEILDEYISSKIDYLRHNVVTDGVHDVAINDQVIELLEDILAYMWDQEI